MYYGDDSDSDNSGDDAGGFRISPDGADIVISPRLAQAQPQTQTPSDDSSSRPTTASSRATAEQRRKQQELAAQKRKERSRQGIFPSPA